MASLAAKARLQTDRLIRRGKTPIEAFNAAIEAYKVETGDKNGFVIRQVHGQVLLGTAERRISVCTDLQCL